MMDYTQILIHFFLDVCDLRLDLEIFDLRGPTAVDQADTTDNCPDSLVVSVRYIKN